MIESIRNDLKTALADLWKVARAEEGSVFVVGCSTSEIAGKRIGTGGNGDLALVVFETLAEFCRDHALFLAAQCCEHLNRSLVVEREAYRHYNLVRVNAVPKPGAGGAFASAAYEGMDNPVLVESVRAALGIDIGNTLIGMHLMPVAVPVRASVSRVGEAALVLARTRAPYVGGTRAVYDPDLG